MYSCIALLHYMLPYVCIKKVSIYQKLWTIDKLELQLLVVQVYFEFVLCQLLFVNRCFSPSEEQQGIYNYIQCMKYSSWPGLPRASMGGCRRFHGDTSSGVSCQALRCRVNCHASQSQLDSEHGAGVWFCREWPHGGCVGQLPGFGGDGGPTNIVPA